MTLMPYQVLPGLGLSGAFLRQERHRGALKARRFGSRWLVLDEDLQKYSEAGSAGGGSAQHGQQAKEVSEAVGLLKKIHRLAKNCCAPCAT